MIRSRLFTIVFALWAFLVVLLTSVPALAHDPLQESQEQRGHHHKHHTRSPENLNLADIRMKVLTFREIGDDRYLDDARALLAPALAAANPDPEALVVASFVAQSRHQFDDAIALIRKSLSINERNDEAWLLLASIQLVLGNTEAATRACRQLRNTPTLVLLTCNARVALASGHHQRAYDRLQKILRVIDSHGLPDETLAWSYSVAGDLATAAAKPDEAVQLFRQSLALAERTQVRSALVDVLLYKGDLDAAASSLDKGSQALPLLIRRLIVAERQGRSETVQHMRTKVQQEFNRWIAAEDWLHAREMARFFIDVVDEPARARRLALINIDLQKEPEDRRLEQRTRPSA